jgi:hypothetical protein
MVLTTEPLFTAADAHGAPVLRPGVWNGAPDPSCKFDETAPLANWPSCANGGIVGEAEIRGRPDMNGASAGTPYLLAAGDPRIMQLHGLELAPGSGLSFTSYFYAGLKPTRTDSQGRITAYEAWLVQCGPPPPKDQTTSAGGKIQTGTGQPLPGMVMDKSGANCTTASADALRAAATASRAWASGDLSAHWVRDGDR